MKKKTPASSTRASRRQWAAFPSRHLAQFASAKKMMYLSCSSLSVRHALSKNQLGGETFRLSLHLWPVKALLLWQPLVSSTPQPGCTSQPPGSEVLEWGITFRDLELREAAGSFLHMPSFDCQCVQRSQKHTFILNCFLCHACWLPSLYEKTM